MRQLQEETRDFAPVLARFEQAQQRRHVWETHWQDCYDFTLPQHHASGHEIAGSKRSERIFDGTAPDAADQLAASLIGHLTPPWTAWFGFKAGSDLSDDDAQALAPILEKSAKIMAAHMDASNFHVEMHQCFLDLVIGGTAALYFEETVPGNVSAFKFSAVPLYDVYLEEGAQGFLDGSHRVQKLTLAQIAARYGDIAVPPDVVRAGSRDSQARFRVLESIFPDKGIYHYTALLMEGSAPTLLREGTFNESPAIAFRWMKSPGEIYGRSPVMKALPDIKTANKVVELILKNASIAVTGIWQADDDGVLNPANIELVPGAIIPKAVGSEGLKPLGMPGNFDVSQIVLDDLRRRIRHALLGDRLGQLNDKRMSATEVLERAGETALLLGATYGRLQAELLTPLITRGYNILRRRGEIPDLALDGRTVALDYRSPLARAQGQRSMQNTLSWLQSVLALGAEAAGAVDMAQAARTLGDAMGVPTDLIRKDLTPLQQGDIE